MTAENFVQIILNQFLAIAVLVVDVIKVCTMSDISHHNNDYYFPTTTTIIITTTTTTTTTTNYYYIG